MTEMEIKVEGLEQLQRKIRKLTEPIGPLIEEIVEFAYEKAKEGAKPDVHAKGTIASQMKKELAPGPMPLHGKVYNPSVIAKVIEEGRKPGGKLPSVTNVGRWAEAHGLAAPAFKVARAFQQRGTKGVKFMEKAREATEKKLPKLLKGAAQKIEKGWGR